MCVFTGEGVCSVRRHLHALAALLVGVGVAIAPPADADVARRVYVITTTTNNVTPLVVDLRATAAGDEGFVAVFAVYGGPRGTGADGSMYAMEFGDARTVRLGVGGNEVDSCAAGLATCGPGAEPGTFTLKNTGRNRLSPGVAVYIAVDAAGVELKLGRGLRARVVNGGLQRVTGGGADVVHAGVGRGHVARFAHAELPGGRRGSVALGVIPCELGGVGEAAMLGDGSKSLSCGSAGTAVTSLAAAGPVSWRLTGETTGVSRSRTRLAVVDLV